MLHGLHKATSPRRRYQQEALGGDGAQLQCMAWPSKKEPQMPKPKEQLMFADTVEGNWRLVLTNYPMKEFVKGKG